MAPSKVPTRDQQPYTSGTQSNLGQTFSSPIKRSNPKKPLQFVAPLGSSSKRRRLALELEALELAAVTETEPILVPKADDRVEVPLTLEPDVWTTELSEPLDIPEPPFTDFPEVTTHTPRRIILNRAAKSLYSRWQNLLPLLVDPFLSYSDSVTGLIPTTPSQLEGQCSKSTCLFTTVEVLCLYHTHYYNVPIRFCECQELPSLLLSYGLFPTAPTKPRMAVSVHLLDFYNSLFERSCDAINALAGALNAFYKRRGYVMVNQKGEAVQDPFRKGLGYAVQWYSNLHARIEQVMEAAIISADTSNYHSSHEDDRGSIPPTTQPQSHSQLLEEEFVSEEERPVFGPAPPPLPLTECARILQRRCPACFSGATFGQPFAGGGDIHVSVDGNFNHRHLKSSGDCPPFYEPEYIISKAIVDAAGQNIEEARRKPPKSRQPSLPDEAVDECESMHIAGSGSNSKTNMEKFDDGGLMALVCRHDIPLFLANIDTPGEQQKYAVALIQHFFSFLPPTATVAVLYDVGCVLDRSCHLYNILPDTIVSRLLFATTAMHAYVHEWACQLVYNPRLRQGLGLTDGEGVERLWSQMRKLIGITRSSHRHRRIWMLDRQVRFIGLEHRDGLGTWLKRRLKGVEEQGAGARGAMKDCRVAVEVLHEQWADQRQAQLSIRAHAPTKLKKELDSVLTLQGQMEAIDQAIHALRSELSTADAPPTSLKLLSNLQQTQEEFKEQGEALYSSLNVHDSFPELANIDLDFVRVLLTARDLKINIRKRAIGSFLEWDKLDQAVGGRTKLHQATRNAIQKRAPALMNAIRKFNGYCETLASVYKSDWSIPLPEPLPVKLAELRESPLLMEDVWISKAPGERPRWLAEPKVREGIRAMLRVDRCIEERRRLGIEADNLCRWYGRELRALRTALSSNSNWRIFTLLQRQYDHLLLLRLRWSNPLASSLRFEAHIQSTTVALPTQPLTWIPAVVQVANDDLVDADAEDEHVNVSVAPDDHTMDDFQDTDVPIHGEDGEDNTLLVDFILEADEPSEQSVDGPITPMAAVPIIWELPPNYREDLPSTRELLLFDSFAARDPWVDEIKDLHRLIEKLVINANRHGHPLHVVTEEGWTARPVLLHSSQSNGYDCGLWVLATISAVLCGYHSSGLVESDMPNLRSYLLRHILALPVYTPRS
ncbi:hypothetical protein C0991_010226 [Blastosporella zonata]|nr:hypothetical protein C0991_010226 [Blastosporella zonata]